MSKFSIGKKVSTADGHKGKVTFTDTARKKVAVEITEPGTPGTKKGEVRTYNEKDVR